MNKNLYIYIALGALSLCTYVSYTNFVSLRLQHHVLKEFNENNYSDATLNKVLNRKSFLIPNISLTAMPLKVLYARYYHLSNDHQKALDMLNKKERDNPYLYTYETLKATIFNNLGVLDSAKYYSKKAFYGLPGNAVNFELYIKTLVQERDTVAIKQAFKDVTIKSDPQFWQIYFAGILNLKSENDQELKTQAMAAKKKFPENKKVQVVSDFILYGQANIENAIKYNDTALTLFNNNDFIKAAEYYSKAANLNPSDYTFFENAGVSFYQQQRYSEAAKYFSHVMDSLNPRTGKSEYLNGLCLIELGFNDEACESLEKSMRYNFKPAFAVYSKNCK